MLLVLVIYQIYEISEGQKRTITAGSDAQQNASYGLYVLGRDLAIAGNGIASMAATLDQCAHAAPDSRAHRRRCDGARSGHDHRALRRFESLSTPVPFMQNSAVNTTSSRTVRGSGASRLQQERRDRRSPGRQVHAVDDRRRRRRRRRHDRFRDADAHAGGRRPGRDVLGRHSVGRQSGPSGVDGAHRVHGRSDRRVRAHAEAACRPTVRSSPSSATSST